MAKNRKTRTANIVKTVIGGAAGGAAVQVVKGTLTQNLDPLYTGIGAIAVGAVVPAFVKMDGVAELGAGMIGAGAAMVLANTVPSLAGFNSALYGTKQTAMRQRLISGPKKKGVIKTLG